MTFEIDKIKIEELVQLHRDQKLNLNPPYQRNSIWSRPAQKSLVSTILRGWPLPALFFKALPSGNYEVVDGQQRLRAIFDFVGNRLSDSDGVRFQDMEKNDVEKTHSFQKYDIPLVIVNELTDAESIESFYSLVNRSGLRLNRPELAKATYYNTEFLRLVEQLGDDDSPFGGLGIFTAASKARMNHVDFVSELVALQVFGVSDKKEKVDELFEDDISETDSARMFQDFNHVIETLHQISEPIHLNRTRFRQKNDFYTLFGFIEHCLKEGVDLETMREFFKILLALSPLIRPSQEDCDVLREYARNCVTQSNSKSAREARFEILCGLLLNETDEPNQSQREIMDYFELNASQMALREGRWLTFSPSSLKYPDFPELPI